MATADFHLHSSRSDGVMPPSRVVEMASAAGVRRMALTDHDTTDGLAEAGASARDLGIALAPGIELSTDMDGVDCHLLALGLRWQDTAWQDFLASQRNGRRGRLERMVAVLAGEGAQITIDRVLEIAGESSVGRPHVARALVEKGYVANVAEAFDRWLGNGMVADIPREKLAPAEAIDRVHSLGGIIVVAHPPFMGDDYAERVTLLARWGADGVETYYKDYPPETITFLGELARTLNCIPSGGSDYHGLGNPNDRAVGDISFPDRAVERFVEFIGERCAIPWVEEPPHA